MSIVSTGSRWFARRRTLGRDEKVDAGLARLALELIGNAAHFAHRPAVASPVSPSISSTTLAGGKARHARQVGLDEFERPPVCGLARLRPAPPHDVLAELLVASDDVDVGASLGEAEADGGADALSCEGPRA